VELLDSPIRPYAWGSRTVLASLRGRAVPSPTPEAELWMGAHPAAPSTVSRPAGPVSLAEVIRSDPDGMLGAQVARRFGPRLPYLLKVLAAAEPLSLQAHPDAERARRGYAAERAAGVTDGNYADEYHKPELLVAVSRFEALCGFREPEAAAKLLDGLGVPDLAPVANQLRDGDLRAAVSTLLQWPAAERPALVAAVVAAAASAAAVSAVATGSRRGYAGDAYAVVGRLAEHHPGDVGVIAALLLNYVRLAPGEAIWMPAGNLHGYLCGTGVEVMAASDNVLRGGLTAKRVDVPELLRVLRFTPLADPVMAAVPVAPGVMTWPVPVDDFRLHRVDLTAGSLVRLPVAGPRTVFCLTGEVGVDDGRPVRLGPGEAAFGPATEHPLLLTGSGSAFVASTGP
jgi:mannose-6-phosphate isomerase